MEAQNQKTCPYCGETILASAKKCRYCQSWLDGREEMPATVTSGGAVESGFVNEETTEDQGCGFSHGTINVLFLIAILCVLVSTAHDIDDLFYKGGIIHRSVSGWAVGIVRLLCYIPSWIGIIVGGVVGVLFTKAVKTKLKNDRIQSPGAGLMTTLIVLECLVIPIALIVDMVDGMGEDAEIGAGLLACLVALPLMIVGIIVAFKLFRLSSGYKKACGWLLAGLAVEVIFYSLPSSAKDIGVWVGLLAVIVNYYFCKSIVNILTSDADENE
ncbi:MAG: hypothetical protein K2H17_08325 [Duncaniella sp.]|uniref:hypothetical protein n=1 Tax=Duncaniella sp. TaxID=2518496 RepID=UPI0023C780BF|nr:hypothetical protein [Duncaniella sp.]MDE5989390.1 hypothetical protein [Duncaniella sp.]